jgi:hypothetical protein
MLPLSLPSTGAKRVRRLAYVRVMLLGAICSLARRRVLHVELFPDALWDAVGINSMQAFKLGCGQRSPCAVAQYPKYGIAKYNFPFIGWPSSLSRNKNARRATI